MRWPQPTRQKTLVLITIVCTAAVAGLFVLSSGQLQQFALKIEWFARDNLIVRHGRQAVLDPRLVYLAIDEPSIKLDMLFPDDYATAPTLKLMKEGNWPWPRNIYPLILQRLLDAGASVVAMDLLFPTPRDGDADFKAALDRYRDRVVLGCNFAEVSNESGGSQIGALDLPSTTLIPSTSPLDARVGFVNFWPDPWDGTVREMNYHIRFNEAFGSAALRDDEILSSFSARILQKAGMGKRVPKEDGAKLLRFSNQFGRVSLYQIFLKATWEAANFDNGRFFKDKIVVIGPYGNFLQDFHDTPFGSLPGPELHLNALNAALQNEFLSELPLAAQLVIILAAGAFAYSLCVFISQPILRFAALLLSLPIYYLSRSAL